MAVPSTSIGRTDFGAVKSAIHRKLIQKISLDRVTEVSREEVRREVGLILEALVVGESTPMNLQERERLAQEVLDEVFGLGPLEPLLADPTVTDILVNTYKRVYVERKGMLDQTSVQFRDDAHLMAIIDRIVSAVGRRVDESTLGGWPLPFDPPIWSQQAVSGGFDQQSVDDARDARAVAGMREGAPEHFDLGRNRRRKNNFSKCIVHLHFGSRANRDN
jgi:hypothetical protein